MRLQASAVLLFAGVLLYFAGAYAAANPPPNRRPPDHSTVAMLFSAVVMCIGAIGVIRSMWGEAAPASSRKPLQFGLRSLMVVMLIVAVFFGYVTYLQRAEEARRAENNQELQRIGENLRRARLAVGN